MAFVRFARAVIVPLVLESLRQGGEEGGLFGGSDTFTALAAHGRARRAPASGDDPRRPRSGPGAGRSRRRPGHGRDQPVLAGGARPRHARRLRALHREPLPDGQAVRYLGTVEVLVEAYGALEMFQDPD
ncbi:hypothetical protein [Brachybacterium sp. GPGPB12]|uniref:hypothetical protein n=1 Tax=Brachybacterium sp. GPGPB12 TaxID=3023517 RepID=UPI003134646A